MKILACELLTLKVKLVKLKGRRKRDRCSTIFKFCFKLVKRLKEFNTNKVPDTSDRVISSSCTSNSSMLSLSPLGAVSHDDM